MTCHLLALLLAILVSGDAGASDTRTIGVIQGSKTMELYVGSMRDGSPLDVVWCVPSHLAYLPDKGHMSGPVDGVGYVDGAKFSGAA